MPYASDHPRIWYERRGAGEPLLFITGFTISSAVFEPVLELYERHFDCIWYDNRSSGRSGARGLLTSIPQFAGDAVRVLDALGVDSAHVYGLSMGGMIAQELAIRFPERVRGLVLGGTTPGGPRAVRPAVAELGALAGSAVGALQQPGRPWLGALVFSETFRREHPERVRELLAYFRRHRAGARGLLAHWWATVYHDTVSRLGRIQAPTLVLHGGEDAMSPLANARLLAARIPDAELVIVPGAGHAYMLERPEQSLELLAQWMRAHEPIAAGRPVTGVAAHMEPMTRALGLPVGMFRTGASLLRRATEPWGLYEGPSNPTEGDRDVAPDRRAA
jgi:pimeloyl-ACP methyl ester carboxylesterase